MNLSLNDISYEIYLEYIIQLLGFKEIGVLSIVSKTLKEIFDHNDIWKQFYFKLNPPIITGNSIHIGDHRKDKYLDYGSLVKKYNVCKPCYWTKNETINSSYNMSTGCCKGLEGLIPPLKVAYVGADLNIPYIKDQSESVKNKYYKLIRDIHLTKNLLGAYNQCQNPNHYIEDTLSNNRNEITCNSFKKQTLSELNTQIKNKNKSHKSNLTRKTKSLKLLEKKMKILKEELDKLNTESTKYTEFTDKSTESIDLLYKQFGKTKIIYNTTHTKITHLTVRCPAEWNAVIIVPSPSGRLFKTRVPPNIKPGDYFMVKIPLRSATPDIDGGQLLSTDWSIYKSEEYNRWYYHNSVTKITQWERPINYSI